MKRVLMILAIVLSVAGQANAAGIKKQPGESVTLIWMFNLADEAKISGFRLESAPTSAGPYTTVAGVTSVPAGRQMIFPAAFSTGSVMVFYRVYAYFISGTNTIVSVSDPVAGVEVDMAVPGPMGTQGR